MFKSLNSLNLDNIKIKNSLIFLLIVFSLFLAFGHYPPIMALWEEAHIYKNFIPTENPFLLPTKVFIRSFIDV